MKKMRFIGDIHGKVHDYSQLLKEAEKEQIPTVQIGDFGFGFISPDIEDNLNKQFEQSNHKFIRGNHDDPARCRQSPGFIKDGTVDEENNIMYIGGAWSIDFFRRTPGINWWEDEECSFDQLMEMIEVYETVKPRIMITHDAPQELSTDLIIRRGLGMGNNVYPTKTGQALQTMWEIHKPDIWIFGHWHNSVDENVDGCRVICLDELEWKDIELC